MVPLQKSDTCQLCEHIRCMFQHTYGTNEHQGIFKPCLCFGHLILCEGQSSQQIECTDYTHLDLHLPEEVQAVLDEVRGRRLLALGKKDRAQAKEHPGAISYVVLLTKEREALLQQGAGLGILPLLDRGLCQEIEHKGEGLFVATLSGKRTTLFQEEMHGSFVALLHGEPGYPKQGGGQVPCLHRLLDLTIHLQTLFTQQFCSLYLTMYKGEPGGPTERFDPHRRTEARLLRQRPLQPGTPFSLRPTHGPKTHQGTSQAQSYFFPLHCLFLSCLIQRPVQGGAQVILFAFQSIKPLHLFCTKQRSEEHTSELQSP